MEPVGNNPYLPLVVPRETKKSEATKSGRKKSFSTEVEQAKNTLGAAKFSEDEIAKLMEAVWEAGKRLVREPGIGVVQDYRGAISSFIAAIVGSSYSMKSYTGILKSDHSKAQYALVHVINQKLDGLATAILQGQKDPMEILRRTDELKGLLIDLRH